MTNKSPLRRPEYHLPNAEQLRIPAGADGLRTEVWPDPSVSLTVPSRDASQPRLTVYKLDPGDGSCGPAFQRMHQQSESRNTLDKRSVVEIICEGYSHLYRSELYPEIAPIWLDRLRAEGRTLIRNLEIQRAAASEYLKPDGSLAGKVCTSFADLRRAFSGKNAPTLKDYDDLLERARHCAEVLKNCKSEYALLHEAGFELAWIRDQADHLRANILERWNGAINIAELGQKGAEQLEAGAFWILDLYGEVFAKDPARQFAYKFTLITFRSSGHGIGVAIDGGAFREVFHEVWTQSRKELPQALTKLLLSSLKRTFPDPDNLSPIEVLAEQLVSLCLFVFFTTIDFWVFEAPTIPPDERQEEFGMKMAEGLSEQVIDAIKDIMLARYVHDLPKDLIARKQVERLGEVVATLINSTIRELLHMLEKAKSEKAPFFDIFCAEAGGAIVRIVKDIAATLLAEPIKDVMRGSIGKSRLEWEGFIKSLILRSPARKISPEPPALVPPESHPKEKPPKPDRATRAEVPLVPGTRRPVLASNDSPYLGPTYTLEEIELAQRTGDIRISTGKENGVHVLEVVVKNEHNQPVAKWYEVSHNGIAKPGALKLSHTEQQVLTRLRLGKVEVGKQLIPLRPAPGWTIEMTGVQSIRGTKNRFSESTQRAALERQGNKCASCGTPISDIGDAGIGDHLYGEGAEAHHIKHDKNHGPADVQNCVVICKACHYAVHGGGRYRDRDIDGQPSDFEYYFGVK